MNIMNGTKKSSSNDGLAALAYIATAMSCDGTNIEKVQMTAASTSSCKSSVSSSRKPVKKRSVPFDFGAGIVAKKSTKKASSSSPNKPKSKRQYQQSRRATGNFKMKANQPSFPTILMGILSAPQNNNDCIQFLPDEQSFIIVNPNALERNVLPTHFQDNVPTLEQFLYLLAIW